MRLGQLLKKWRMVTERDLRSVAKEIGTSASTLSRFERGEEITADTLSKIMVWAFAKDKGARA